MRPPDRHSSAVGKPKGRRKEGQRKFPSLKFGVGSTHLKAPPDGSSPPPLVAPNPDPARPVVGALRVCACVDG